MAVPKVMTPYMATKIMNAHRESVGLKPVNSPMLYIQAGKGKFEIAIDEATGKKKIANLEKFYEWVVEHNMRQVARRDKKNLDDETFVREHANVVRLAITAG